MNEANSSQTGRNLSIKSKYNPDFRDEAKRLKLSQGELFDKLWEKYQEPSQIDNGGLGLTSEEHDLIQRAIDATGLKFYELLKQGFLKEAESLIAPKVEEKNAPQELTAAEKRVWEKLNELMFWNSYCKPEHRVYLSPSLVRRCHAAAYPQIVKVLAIREQDIAAHHKQFGISEDANRKGRDSQGRQIKVEELVNSYFPPNKTQQGISTVKNTEDDAALQELEKTEEKPVQEPTNSVIQIQNCLSPKDYFERLKDEPNPSIHQKAADALLASLRDELDIKIAVNGNGELLNRGKGNPTELDKELEKYRRLFRSYPLNPAITGYRQFKNPKLPKSFEGGKAPEGARLNDEGLVIAEPRHMAINYLALSEVENAYMNLSRDSQKYAEQYPNYFLSK